MGKDIRYVCVACEDIFPSIKNVPSHLFCPLTVKKERLIPETFVEIYQEANDEQKKMLEKHFDGGLQDIDLFVGENWFNLTTEEQIDIILEIMESDDEAEDITDKEL